jgi:DNA-binding beta-propeller fold protein YncE
MSIDNGIGTVTGNSLTVKPSVTTTYILTATSAAGTTTTAKVLVTVVAAPSITSFTTSAATITAGGSATLSWTATGAASLSIDNSVGTVTGTSITVKPAATTTYTLTAANAAGATATATVTVAVVGAPAIASFTTSAAEITAGGSATLSWAATGAATISINNGVGAVTGTSITVKPATTTTYTLTATNAAGTAVTATATVTVVGTPAIASFTTSAAEITAGGSATLSWTATGDASLSIDNGVGTVTGTSVSVKPSATTTYTLTATNAAGTTVTAAVTVTVIAAPAIASFTTANPVLTPATTGPSGATLSWTATGASKLSIDNGVGTVTGTSVTVSPAATTTYTLTAANAAGATATATVTVQVRNNLGALAGQIYATPNNLSYFYGVGFAPCAYPNAVATDGSGNLYIADEISEAICKVTPSGAVTVLASDGSNPYLYRDGASGAPANAAAASSQARSTSPSARSASGNNLVSLRSLLTKPSHAAAAQSTAPQPAASSSNQTDNAGLEEPVAIAVTSDGSHVYVADENRDVIRQITIATDGTASISTLAGANGCGSEDGPGAEASFCRPTALAVDAAGHLYVTDSNNGTIRQIVIASDGTGTVSTLAGVAGVHGTTDSAGGIAVFGNPQGIAASADGANVYVADNYSFYNNAASSWTYTTTIRKIAIASDGTAVVSTVAGGNQGYQDGTGTAAEFGWNDTLALSSDGTTLYVGEPDNSVIRQIAIGSGGTVTVSTLAGNIQTWGQADGVGTAAWFWGPTGVALDGKGNLYVADYGYNGDSYGLGGLATLRKVALSTDQVSTLILNVFGTAGGSADGAGNTAGFDLPWDVVADNSGNLYVADAINSTIRKIAVAADGTATVSTLAGTAGVRGHADGTGSNAQFNSPIGLAIDSASGYLYVVDSGNATIRKIDLSSGAVTTLAGKAGNYGLIDGTGSSASFETPERLALFGSDYLFVSDNGNLRVVAIPTGQVTTLQVDDAAGNPINNLDALGLAVYSSADQSTNYLFLGEDCDIRRIDLTNATGNSSLTATTLAGSQVCGYEDGTGNSAMFDGLWDLAVDSQGNLYAADLANSVIRRITPSGATTTVIGSYGSYTTTLGALPSTLFMPLSVAVDPTDNLLVTVPNAVLTLQP